VVFCCFSIGFWNCPDWYFVVYHGYWNCSDSAVFCYFSIRTVLNVVFCCFSWMLELFWQCGILLFFY
jgi:hypothetical protein